MSAKKLDLDLDFGLESIQPIKEISTKEINVDYSDVNKLLNDVSILDIVLKKSNITSAKFDKVREEKVQNGFSIINKINSDTDILGINPLILLLGKFWEHKEHRANIKSMIDAEADKLGYHSSDYVQKILGEQIDKLNDIATSIDRLLFVKTYYKPRPNQKKAKLKPKTTMVSIQGVVYDVPIVSYNKAQSDPKYISDREALIEYVISISTISEITLSL
jgi:hypothetical protein